MIWLILLGLHLVGLVGYSLLLRRQAHSNTLHPWVLATMLHTALSVPFIAIAFFVTPDVSQFTVQSLTVVAVAVLLSALLQITIVKALQYLEAGSYAVLYSTRIVFATVFAALLLSEIPSVWKIVGGLLILVAVFVLRQKSSKKIAKRGVAWGFAAAATASSLAIAEKWLINEVGVFTAGPVVVIIGAVMMWAVVLMRRYPLPVKDIFNKQVMGLVTFRALAACAWVFALAAGAFVSVATYISSLSLVIVAVLGIFILKERDYLPRKIISVILAVIGLSIILLSS